jgi:hypothetical protein
MSEKILYWTYETQLLLAEMQGSTIATVRKWCKIAAEMQGAVAKFEHKPRSK